MATTWTSTADFELGTLSGVSTDDEDYVVSADCFGLKFPWASKDGNLMAYWRCEDYSDTTGNLANATGSGTSFVGAKFNNGINFDTGDYATVATGTNLQPTQAFTIAMWSKQDNTTSGRLLSKFKRYSPYYGYSTLTSSNKLYFQLNCAGGGLVQVAASTVLGTSDFHSCIFVYNGTDMRMYVDGSLDNVPAAQTGNITHYNNQPAYMGRIEILAATLNGIMDEVKMYDRALSSTEVTAMHNSGLRYTTDGDWTSNTVSNSELINNIQVTVADVDANNYLAVIEIYDSDDTLLSTFDDGCWIAQTYTLTASDFDHGFTGTDTDYYMIFYLIGDGTKRAEVQEIVVNYGAAPPSDTTYGESLAEGIYFDNNGHLSLTKNVVFGEVCG